MSGLDVECETEEMMGTEKLREHVADWQGNKTSVDRESMQVLNIALAGIHSRNGYEYAEEALQEAIGLYESRPVFLDHATNVSRPHERSTRDLVGSIFNVRFDQQRIRGDIQVLETESGRTFLALAEKKTEFVGMSHVVLARRSADKKMVEKIEEVISVDAVVYPATTSTFQEQVSENEDGDQEEIASEVGGEDSQEPSFSEMELRAVKGELAELRVKHEELLKKYMAMKDRTKDQVSVEQMIRESRLPENAITADFRALLLEASNDPMRNRLLKERLQLWSEIRKNLPCSVSRNNGMRGKRSESRVNEAFVNAIRK